LAFAMATEHARTDRREKARQRRLQEGEVTRKETKKELESCGIKKGKRKFKAPEEDVKVSNQETRVSCSGQRAEQEYRLRQKRGLVLERKLGKVPRNVGKRRTGKVHLLRLTMAETGKGSKKTQEKDNPWVVLIRPCMKMQEKKS